MICRGDNEFSAEGTWTVIVDKQQILLGEINVESAFKILFMTHYVFNLKYESSVSRLFNFIECFIYKVEGVNPIGVIGKFFNSLNK